MNKTQAQKNVIEKSIERHKRHEIKGKISDIKNQIKDTNRAGYFYKNNKALSYRPYSNRFVKDAFTSKAKDISRNEVKNLIRKSLNK